MDERFLSQHLEDAPEPIPFETFRAALTRGIDPSDRFAARFLAMESWMRGLAHVDGAPNAKESYGRYLEWLPFAHRIRAFFEATAKDLGYELDELAQDPGDRLF